MAVFHSAATAAAGTGTDQLVHRLLAAVGGGNWDELSEILHPEFTITEPRSLPWGGVHIGIGSYITLMTAIVGMFDLDFRTEWLLRQGDRMILRATVTFTDRATGNNVAMPTVELFTISGGLLRASEVYFADTAALLALLPSAG
ncbi:nuclear transport factor 2 family protein [Parafrankia discariae]|uniref:nuclear transport factor 2 family protein n=1 Tax=Parafrankia discariae TaxID=365528 RepID=UPI0003A5FD3B|nr:nuclear transport factor 2 family protein [Parafrankia discariae]